MKKEVYIAASKTGQIRVFTSFPERNESFGVWVGESVGCISTLVMMMEADGMELPDLEWSDEPVELKLSLSYG